jgi:hypothetical protein
VGSVWFISSNGVWERRRSRYRKPDYHGTTDNLVGDQRERILSDYVQYITWDLSLYATARKVRAASRTLTIHVPEKAIATCATQRNATQLRCLPANLMIPQIGRLSRCERDLRQGVYFEIHKAMVALFFAIATEMES